MDLNGGGWNGFESNLFESMQFRRWMDENGDWMDGYSADGRDVGKEWHWTGGLKWNWMERQGSGGDWGGLEWKSVWFSG